MFYILKSGNITTDIKGLDDSLVAGHIGYSVDLHGTIELVNLEIKERFQKKGYAKKLRDYVLKELIKKGKKEFETYAFGSMNNNIYDNIKLAKFYKKSFLENGAKNIVITYNKELKRNKRLYHLRATF